MAYIDGFILAVPKDKKDDYRDHAAKAWPLFRDYGVLRHFEAWGDDVPEGKVTDFRKAVQARDGEEVVFSWFEYADKAARDAAGEKMMSDPRMKEIGATMPFDGGRMIYGGFQAIVDEGDRPGGYIDGIVLPVPEGKQDDYRAMARKMAAAFRAYGATRVVESWADDVKDGKITDFNRAVQAEAGEKVVFSFIEWPDKAARDAGWKRMMEEDPGKGMEMPFDGRRMFWGGFRPILDVNAG